MKAFSGLVEDARARTGELGPQWPDAATKIYTAHAVRPDGRRAPAQALEQAQNG